MRPARARGCNEAALVFFENGATGEPQFADGGENGMGGTILDYASTPTRRAIISVNTNAASMNNMSLSFLKQIRCGWQRVHFAMPSAQQNRVAHVLFLLDEVTQVDPATVCDDGDLLHFGGAFVRHDSFPLCPAVLGRSGAAQPKVCWLLHNQVCVPILQIFGIPKHKNLYALLFQKSFRVVLCNMTFRGNTVYMQRKASAFSSRLLWGGGVCRQRRLADHAFRLQRI